MIRAEAFKDSDEWCLRLINDETEAYSGIGALNGQQEAEAVVKAINLLLYIAQAKKIDSKTYTPCRDVGKKLMELM